MTKFELLKTIENIENFALSALEELKKDIDNYDSKDCNLITNTVKNTRETIHECFNDFGNTIYRRQNDIYLSKKRSGVET